MNNIFGTKGGMGVAQHIISMMPPHERYVELFGGNFTIMRIKKLCEINMGFDINREMITKYNENPIKNPCESIPQEEEYFSIGGPMALDFSTIRREYKHHIEIKEMDGFVVLEDMRHRLVTRSELSYSDTLLYCDPPYLGVRNRYGEFGWNEEMHARFLDLVVKLNELKDKPMILISGYYSILYDTKLRPEDGWSSCSFSTQTRGGKRMEHLWFNYRDPRETGLLHDYKGIGKNYRDRERINRRQVNWAAMLQKMPPIERYAMIEYLKEVIQCQQEM